MAAKVQSTPFFLPPGRLVMGSTHELQTTDQQGREREKPTIFFGVAVPKSDPGVGEILGIINQTARTYYANVPHVMAQIEQGLAAPNFAWKVDDGDSEKNRNREGFAGCWVFRFSTSIFPIKAADNQNNPIDPKMIEAGYYVDVAGACAANTLTDKNAGVYLNPNGIRLLGYGPIILQGPSVGQIFAQRPAVLPTGASALPVAAGNPPGNPLAGTPAPAPAPAPAPLGGTPAPAGPGFAQNPPPAATPAPPPPPGMIAAPAPLTVEQIQAESARLAAAAGVVHYGGHRIRPDRSGYDPDPTPAPIAAVPAGMPTTSTPVGTGLAAGAANPLAGGASVPGVPAGASPGMAVPGTAPLGSPGIASPISVAPHPGFLNPPAPTQTPDEISAAIALANNVQHYQGYRFDVGTRQYLPNPQ